MGSIITLDRSVDNLRNTPIKMKSAALLTFLEYVDGEAVAETIRKEPSLISDIVPEFALGIEYNQNTPNHELTLLEHELLTMALLPPNYILRLAGLLHDVGKPLVANLGDDGNYHYHGHMEKSAEICKQAGEIIGMETQELDLLVFLVNNHDHRPHPDEQNVQQFIELCETRERMELLLTLMNADINAHSEKSAKYLTDVMNESLKIINKKANAFFGDDKERRN